MPTVHNLSRGPIVGHTTESSFRVWGQCDEPTGKVGAIRWRPVGSNAFSAPAFFDFLAHLDGVGVVDITAYEAQPLSADTEYEFEIGVVDKERNSLPLDWRAFGVDIFALQGSVKTFPVHGSGVSFLVGSCRDPSPPGDEGESTFASMLADMDENAIRPPNFCLMLGDQIYVDGLVRVMGLVKAPIEFQTFIEKYRRAFSLPKFAGFCARCPTYMIFDDHEIQNNWTRQKFENDTALPYASRKFHKSTLENGLMAYLAYQEIRNPQVSSALLASFATPGNLPAQLLNQNHYYSFSCGNSAFFVLDCRGESDVPRSAATHSGNNQLLSKAQLDALFKWLKESPERHKFVACGIPLCPDTQGLVGEPDDKWKPAAAQRTELLNYIFDNKIRNVVFLGGDVHVSYVGQITSADDPDFCAHIVVSSAFNWVAPGLQKSSFAWGPIHNGTAPGRYRCDPLLGTSGKIIRRNNYVQIDTTGDHVMVTIKLGINGSIIEQLKLP